MGVSGSSDEPPDVGTGIFQTRSYHFENCLRDIALFLHMRAVTITSSGTIAVIPITYRKIGDGPYVNVTKSSTDNFGLLIFRAKKF